MKEILIDCVKQNLVEMKKFSIKSGKDDGSDMAISMVNMRIIKFCFAVKFL